MTLLSRKIVIIISCLLFVSCVKTNAKTQPYFEVKDGHAYVSPELADEIVRFRNELPLSDLKSGSIPFIQATPVWKNNPFVHLLLGDTSYVFAIDTGMPYSVIFTAPSSIMRGDSFGTVGSTSCVVQIGENLIALNFRMMPDSTHEWGIDNASETGVDGILGINFFEQFNNVVFDYNQNLLLLNQPPISSNALPVIYAAGFGALRPLLQITVDGKNEIGLIDTGAYSVLIREKFGDGNWDFPLEELKKSWKDKTPVELQPNRQTVLKNVQIGDVIMHDIPAEYWDSNNTTTNDWARRTTKYVNFFGTDMWKGHVIQLDLRNDLFRIK